MTLTLLTLVEPAGSINEPPADLEHNSTAYWFYVYRSGPVEVKLAQNVSMLMFTLTAPDL